MKADQKIQSEVIQTFKGMFEAYKKKDLKATLSFWADPDVVVIGSGEDEKNVGITQFTKSLKRDWTQAEVTAIDVKNLTVSTANSVAWLSANVTFHGSTEGKEFVLPGRLTGVMEKREDKWLWVQMHLSTPSSEQESGQSWPKAS